MRFKVLSGRVLGLTAKQTVNIKSGWADSQGPGNLQAREMGPHCVVVENCSEEDALLLSVNFCRYYYTPSSCWYSYSARVFSMYCGYRMNSEMEEEFQRTIQQMVRNYFGDSVVPVA